jgi:flagellar motility protein MotE (MotC chaperone)
VTPDNQAYLRGRDVGLRNYCTPEHGFSLGKNGYSANSVCPYPSAADFMDSFREGNKVHQAQVRVNDLESVRTRIKDEMERTRHADEKAKTDKERGDNESARRKLEHDLDETEDHLREAKDKLFHVEMDAHPVRH